MRLPKNKKGNCLAVLANPDEHKEIHRLPLLDGRSDPQDIKGAPTRERKDLASNSSFEKQREERMSGKFFNFSEKKGSDPVFQSVDNCKRFYTKSHPYPLFTITFELSAFIGISEEQKSNERNEVRGGVMRAA